MVGVISVVMGVISVAEIISMVGIISVAVHGRGILTPWANTCCEFLNGPKPLMLKQIFLSVHLLIGEQWLGTNCRIKHVR